MKRRTTTMRDLVSGLALLVALALTAPATRADVKLHALFQDNMVLQRDVEVPVWGWADDGEKVTVTIQGQSASATAADGKWMVRLKDLKPAESLEMKVAGANEITLANVAVGEVWLCTGQSNMVWNVAKTEAADETVAESDKYAAVRLFTAKFQAADDPQTDTDGQWRITSRQTAGGFSAVGTYFGRKLHDELGVPVGLIQSAIGGTPAEAWTPREPIVGNPDLEDIDKSYQAAAAVWPEKKPVYEAKLAEWKVVAKKARDAGERPPRRPRPPMGPINHKRPYALYNGMIAPLQPFAIRGVIWYQGEANSRSEAQGRQYRTLFPAMIQAWRDAWGQGDFPFYYAQLAAHKTLRPGWPWVREAQLMTLDALPETGMAVISDLDGKAGIHPTVKKPVGERLARWALAKVYGRDIVYSGPLYNADKTSFENGKAIVGFDHVVGGLVAKGGPLKGFEIAGADKTFVPARAMIQDGRVVVSSPEVADPVSVRYAWQAYPEDANLYNREGLPASPFRTDDWSTEDVGGK